MLGAPASVYRCRDVRFTMASPHKVRPVAIECCAGHDSSTHSAAHHRAAAFPQQPYYPVLPHSPVPPHRYAPSRSPAPPDLPARPHSSTRTQLAGSHALYTAAPSSKLRPLHSRAFRTAAPSDQPRPPHSCAPCEASPRAVVASVRRVPLDARDQRLQRIHSVPSALATFRVSRESLLCASHRCQVEAAPQGFAFFRVSRKSLLRASHPCQEDMENDIDIGSPSGFDAPSRRSCEHRKTGALQVWIFLGLADVDNTVLA